GTQCGLDSCAALGRMDEHAVVAKLLFVVCDGDFNRRLAAENAMAAGRAPALDIRNVKGNHIFTEKRDNPSNGPDEAHAALAGPIHRFREIDTGYDAGQRFP